MSDATAPATPQAEPQRMAIAPAPGSMLDLLLEEERVAAAAFREAEDRLKSTRDQIKAVLTEAHPGVPAFDIGGNQHRPPMTLVWVQTVRVDAKAMKTQDPETYVKWAVFGGRWELRASRGA